MILDIYFCVFQGGSFSRVLVSFFVYSSRTSSYLGQMPPLTTFLEHFLPVKLDIFLECQSRIYVGFLGRSIEEWDLGR
jgi:hypothetical protein